MGILQKLQRSGLAQRAMTEARKPQNQAKIKDAVRKVQQRRKPRPR
jgi:hypothetical protein